MGGEVLLVGGMADCEIVMTTEFVTVFPLKTAFTLSVTNPVELPAVNWVEVPVDGFTLPRELFNVQV